MHNTACERCPHCSGILPTKTRKVSAPKIREILTDLSGMKEAELRAYFKSIEPAADLAFTLRPESVISPELRARFEALDPWGNRAEFYRQYWRLKGLLREEFRQRDIAAHVAAGHELRSDTWMRAEVEHGSTEWFPVVIGWDIPADVEAEQTEVAA